MLTFFSETFFFSTIFISNHFCNSGNQLVATSSRGGICSTWDWFLPLGLCRSHISSDGTDSLRSISVGLLWCVKCWSSYLPTSLEDHFLASVWAHVTLSRIVGGPLCRCALLHKSGFFFFFHLNGVDFCTFLITTGFALLHLHESNAWLNSSMSAAWISTGYILYKYHQFNLYFI